MFVGFIQRWSETVSSRTVPVLTETVTVKVNSQDLGLSSKTGRLEYSPTRVYPTDVLVRGDQRVS